MSKGANQRYKLIRLIQIFYDSTNADNMLTRKEIAEKLYSDWGIEVNQRTLITDIDSLVDLGIEIITVRRMGTYNRYYLDRHIFTVPEARYLMDVLQASNFLPEEYTGLLISKIRRLVGEKNWNDIKRCAFMSGRPKPTNKDIFKNIYSINSAIQSNYRISFSYLIWDDKCKLVEKHPGKVYDASPIGMVIDDEKYYLVAYDEDDAAVKHFRIDKMSACKIKKGNKRNKDHIIKESHLISYANKLFRMFSEEEYAYVSLSVDSKNVRLIIDRFGNDIKFRIDNNNPSRRIARIEIQIGSQFYAWLLSQKNMVRLEGPDYVIKRMKDEIKFFYESY